MLSKELFFTEYIYSGLHMWSVQCISHSTEAGVRNKRVTPVGLGTAASSNIWCLSANWVWAYIKLLEHP